MFEKTKRQIVNEHRKAFEVLHLEAPCAFVIGEAIFDFKETSVDELCSAYNGIGPDRLPWPARMLITCGSRIFAPAALAHDWEYTIIIDMIAHEIFSNDLFANANNRFYRNCVTIVNLKYGIFNPLRYIWLGVAKVFKCLCDRYGMRGIEAGVERRLSAAKTAKNIVAEVLSHG